MVIPTLITKSDIQKYRTISDNINDTDRLKPFIDEAVNHSIREFLGEKMFYDFITNYTETKYTDLLNGETWAYGDDVISFDGLKPAICYLAYARFIQNQGVNVTRFGVVSKVSEYSEPIEDKTLARLVSQARLTAQAYIEQAELFLNNHTSTYDLWLYSSATKPQGAMRITCVTNYNDTSTEDDECIER